MKHSCYLQTPIGVIYIEENGEAVTTLCFDREYEKKYCLDAPAKEIKFLTESETDLLKRAGNQLIEYFQGKRTEFTLPLAPQGTDFQKKVWKALRTIPYGQTRSYGQIAAQIGNSKACRAVGGANNKNPIMIFIPCHRVIGADGSLVGFGGGLYAKEYMLNLEREGIR
ncbi:methylated-DNA--[protein]-cysteine S-methyltransferase [Parablautia muri]|uniref:Methylated-DNA--protein-cysteine methyltransferase n=1 Tax=Parablautia muri TaxID=2320879 RepID=A0A9X5BED7_9FIRM|nr:methylated-DNA--[protein]-cysteine S-methyltransferase [Parablautia muri]NBJ92476.1 methylated-DNA--[protein]-cysteine S-methyltransferase [Parablautia muri]